MNLVTFALLVTLNVSDSNDCYITSFREGDDFIVLGSNIRANIF